MDEKDIKLRLLADIPILIEGFGVMEMPSVKKIIELGETVHNTLISSLLFEKKQLKDKEGIEDYSTYEIFLKLSKADENFRDIVITALNLYFQDTPNYLEGYFYLFKDDENIRVLEENHFEEIKKVLKIAYSIKEEKEEEFANEKARKMWEKAQKNKEKLEKYSKSGVDMHSLLSGVLWKSTKPVNEILQLNIYQLYDGLHRLKNIDEYEHVNFGVYTGNIDPKENKNMLSKLHWTTKINLEE